MDNELLRGIYQHELLTYADIGSIVSRHHPLTFKKGDYLLQEGKVADAFFVIEAGLVRSFVYDYKGDDITTGFTQPGEIAIEVNSLFQRVPSEENIIALSDGKAWRMSFDDFQILFHQYAGLTEWGRGWMSHQLFAAKQRSINMITRPAAERYAALLTHKPYIIQHAPLKQIASYLGITDSSLSRIRKEFG